MAQHTTTSARPQKHTLSLKQKVLRKLWLGFSAIVLAASTLAGFGLTLGGALVLSDASQLHFQTVHAERPVYASSAMGPEAALSPLSTAFTQEVQYWAPLIKAWAVVYQIDPNLIATVIQIESCGDSRIASPAGAQGLFQVMPFHFQPGEDMLDVQTNAQHGINYLLDGLKKADGHVGLALAGYNGGHGVIPRGWAAWAPETQRYYYWGSRIYSEIVSGMETSPTLEEWLNAGGQNLCAQARQSQKEIEEQQARLLMAAPQQPG